MKQVGVALRKRGVLFALVLLLLAGALMAPTAMSFSGGITKDNAQNPDFEKAGCTACHGANHAFGPDAESGIAAADVEFVVLTPEGTALAGPYEADVTYTIHIKLHETNALGEANRAGFNLRASDGKLVGVEGSSQTSTDGLQATHVNAGSTEWTVSWESAEEGPVVFQLFVNDVDGDAAPDAGDFVYERGYFLTGEDAALPGAVSHEEAHVGVELPQYWVGLIALAGVGVIIAFTFFYMKYSSPHNTDKKDR